jgi:hypothetical protein
MGDCDKKIEAKKNQKAGVGNQPMFESVPLVYETIDPAEQEAVLAYHECMKEMKERERASVASVAAAKPNEGHHEGEPRGSREEIEALMFGAAAAGMENLQFKTPSPAIRDPFAPLTQPIHQRSCVLPPVNYHEIFNPFGYSGPCSYGSSFQDGRRSAPPLLPSPTLNLKTAETPRVASKLAPRNNKTTSVDISNGIANAEASAKKKKMTNLLVGWHFNSGHWVPP